jgi:hypothetical protein
MPGEADHGPSFQIFIRMDMLGKRTASFFVTSSTTVAELKRMIEDKEGATDVRMNYAGKPLRDELTMQDYNIRREVTIMTSLSLDGGASAAGEGVVRTFDHKEAVHYGVKVRTDKGCDLMMSDHCASATRFSLGCDNVICCDCAYKYLDASIENNGDCTIKCWNSSLEACREHKLDVAAMLFASGCTKEERATFEIQLGKNYMQKEAIICPSPTCQTFLHGDKSTFPGKKLICSKCRYEWCKICVKKWTASGYEVCGYPKCGMDDAARIAFIRDPPRKTITGVADVPCYRLCPSTSCQRFLDHAEACKHFTCVCKHEFCFSCLKPWAECSLGTICTPAPVQL